MKNACPDPGKARVAERFRKVKGPDWPLQLPCWRQKMWLVITPIGEQEFSRPLLQTKTSSTTTVILTRRIFVCTAIRMVPGRLRFLPKRCRPRCPSPASVSTLRGMVCRYEVYHTAPEAWSHRTGIAHCFELRDWTVCGVIAEEGLVGAGSRALRYLAPSRSLL